jgi:hypothetical protein
MIAGYKVVEDPSLATGAISAILELKENEDGSIPVFSYASKQSLVKGIAIGSEITASTMKIRNVQAKEASYVAHPRFKHIFRTKKFDHYSVESNFHANCAGVFYDEVSKCYFCTNSDAKLMIYNMAESINNGIVRFDSSSMKEDDTRKSFKLKSDSIKISGIEQEVTSFDVSFYLDVQSRKLDSAVNSSIHTAVTGKYFTKMPFGPNMVKGYWNRATMLKNGEDESIYPTGQLINKNSPTFNRITFYINGKELADSKDYFLAGQFLLKLPYYRKGSKDTKVKEISLPNQFAVYVCRDESTMQHELLRCEGKDQYGVINAPKGIDMYKNIWWRGDFVYFYHQDGDKIYFSQVDLMNK